MSLNNAYKERYEHELEDTQNGRGKRYTRFPKLKAFVFDEAYDTYVQDYDSDYHDGLAKKNEVY